MTSNISELFDSVIRIYQNPSFGKEKCFEIIHSVPQPSIYSLLENFHNNPYVLDFVSTYFHENRERITPDFFLSCFEIFVTKVELDGKWWQEIVHGVIKHSNVETIFDQLYRLACSIVEKESYKAKRGPIFALRELTNRILVDYEIDSEALRPWKPRISNVISLLHEKEILQFCIRNLINDIVVEILPQVVQVWDADSQLDVFTEVASRRDGFFSNFFDNLVTFLMKEIHEESRRDPESSRIHKCILCLQTLFQNHASALEAKGSITRVLPFLFEFTKFEFDAGYLDVYLDCLEIWSTLASFASDNEERENFYRNSLLEVVYMGINHIMISENSILLKKLDYLRDSINESELDEFIAKILDALSVISSSAAIASKVSQSILTQFPTMIGYFENANPTSMDFLLLSRNIQSITSFISHFSAHFLDQYNQHVDLVYNYLQQVCRIQRHIIRTGFSAWNIQSLNITCLHSFQSFYPWIRHFLSFHPAENEGFQLLGPITENIVDILLSESTSSQLQKESANSLRKLVQTCNTPHLIHLPSIQKLMRVLPSLTTNFKSHAKVLDMLHVSISTVCLFRLNFITRDSQQITEESIREMYANYFKFCIIEPFSIFFNALKEDPGNINKLGDVAVMFFSIFKQLAKSMESQKLKLKEIFCANFFQVSSHFLDVLSYYKNNTAVLKEILCTFGNMIRFLPMNDLQYVDNILNMFQQILSGQEIVRHLMVSQDYKIIKRFLSLEEALFSSSNRKVRVFLPKQLTYLRDVIYPAITNEAARVDIQRIYYKIIASILQYHFDYFFDNEHAHFLHFMVQCFADSLEMSDIHTLQSNMEYLQKLHKTFHLFSQAFFRSMFSEKFILRLIPIYQNRQHALSDEKLLSLLYQIVSNYEVMDNSTKKTGFDFVTHNFQIPFKLVHGCDTITEHEFNRSMHNWLLNVNNKQM